MRFSLLFCTTAVLASCAVNDGARPTPDGRFYFPTGLAFVSSPTDPDGVLYVASSNFDKRFGNGTVSAVRIAPLAASGLPPLSPMPSTENLKIEDLSSAIVDVVQIGSFAGEMATFPLPDGSTRLFTPTRSEGSLFQIIDAAPNGQMTCLPDSGSKDCTVGALSLVNWNPDTRAAKPRAPEPSGVGLSPSGDVFVTHIQAADDPIGSGTNFDSYVVRLSASDPTTISAESFTGIGTGSATGSNSVAVGKRYAYISGRFGAPSLRLVDRQLPGRVINTSIEGNPFVSESFNVLDTRDIALSSDERRVYLASRVPDSLIVLDIEGAESDFPRLRVSRAIAVPTGPSQLHVLDRPGRGALVLLTCTTAGVLAIYDDEIGALSAQVPSVGSQPFSLAVDRRPNMARVFVSNFGDGSIGVVDIGNLNSASEARVVAKLGKLQTCLIREKDRTCQEAQQ